MKNEFAWMPEKASTFAGQVDQFYLFMVLVTLFFTFLITAAVIFLSVRYRRRKITDVPKKIHGSNLLEIAWTVIPLILAMVMFFWSAHLYFFYAKAPSDAMEILVTGKQWMWKIQHPTGQREVNALHIPVGQPIRLTMTSEDVIHSFFIPAFRVKQDVLPGRYTSLWFEPTKPGKYHLFCAEYCGTEHSKMRGTVYVMEPSEYEAWLSGGLAAVTPVEAGSQLFEQLGCVTCHAEDSGARGPNLAGVYGTPQMLVDNIQVVADEEYLRESILNPQAKMVAGYQPIMPTFKGLVTETQLMQLIAYIKSLSDAEPAGDAK